MCWLCWGLTSQSTIFQSCRDGAIASWVINQYFRGVKCLAQGHNTATVGLEPRTSRSGVRHSTTEPPRMWISKRSHRQKLAYHKFRFSRKEGAVFWDTLPRCRFTIFVATLTFHAKCQRFGLARWPGSVYICRFGTRPNSIGLWSLHISRSRFGSDQIFGTKR